MLKQALLWVWTGIYLFAIPILGWWIAEQIVVNPPIVAPFLLLSPAYAILVTGAVWWLRTKRTYAQCQRPVESHEYGDTSIALLPDNIVKVARFVSGCLYVNEDIWRQLSEEARAYLVALHMPNRTVNWLRQFLKGGLFLAGYVVVSINLWLVLALHIGFGVYCGLWAVKNGKAALLKADAKALAVTQNLEGALEYVKKTETNSELRSERLEALKAAV